MYHDAKKDKFQTCITMGGNLINYPGNCETPTADLLTVKLLLNSIISTPKARFMSLDLKDFYLMTSMKRYEYFQIKLELFPQEIIDLYNLQNKADHNGKSAVGCRVLPRQASLPKNSLSNDYSKQDAPKAKSHQDIGNTSGDQSASHC
jgi:hypothetical protein